MIEWRALPLATVLTVAGAAALGVLLLYFLRARRRVVTVPFLPLWQRVLRDRDASVLLSRLKWLLSLLISVAIVALLATALGDPHPKRDQGGRSIVLLLDASASMGSREASGKTRLDLVRERAADVLARLAPKDRILVVRAAERVTPLSTWDGEPARAREALAGLRAADAGLDLVRALGFAGDALRGREQPWVYIVSDGAGVDLPAARAASGLGDVPVRWIGVGEARANLAVTRLAARRHPLDATQVEAILELVNYGEAAVEAEVTVAADDRVIEVQRRTLAPGEPHKTTLHDLSGVGERLSATVRALDGSDALGTDDVGRAVVPARRSLRVLVVTPGNAYLEAALLLDGSLDVTVIGPAEPTPAGTFHVAFLDGVTRDLPASVASVVYLDPPEESPFRRGAALELFGFDSWKRQSPILRWLALADVQVLEGKALVAEPGDTVLGASAGGPLLIQGVRGGRPTLALAFDVRKSDFVLRAAWPLFILNIVESMAADASGFRSSYETGAVWRVPLPPEASDARLRLAQGDVLRLAIAEPGIGLVRGDRAGFHRVLGADDAELGWVAANLVDEVESRITPAVPTLGAADATGVPGEAPVERRAPWLWLVVAVAAVVTVEWWTFHRRWTL